MNKFKKIIINLFPIIGKYIHFNWGYIEEELKPDDYTMGSSPLFKKVLQENGDWTPFLPPPERQSGRTIETMACVSFSFLNVIEALLKRKYDVDTNLSDRFLAKASGTGQNGNLQSRVADTARKTGLVLETDYPSGVDDFSWNEYYKPLTKDLTDKALLFLNKYEIGYEAVVPNINSMRQALKFSPLWVAGYAWYKNGEYYYSLGSPNHCFVIYSIDQLKSFKSAFDSYEEFNKKLAPDFTVFYPKLITLNKKGESYNTAEILNLIRRGLKYIMRVQGAGEIYEINTEGLKYLSPQEWNDINVQLSADQKKLVGISEEYYQKLLQ